MSLANPQHPGMFRRGTTLGTTDTTVGVDLEGLEAVFDDVHPDTGVRRTNSKVRCRIVRNAATVALKPKYLVTPQATAGVGLGKVDGYCITTGQKRAYPVDEYLPSAGVAVGDLFWIVVEGPSLCVSSRVGADSNVMNVGDRVCAQTAAASTVATTAGHVGAIIAADLSAATSGVVDFSALFAITPIGFAMTARTTGNTDTDTLIFITSHDV